MTTLQISKTRLSALLVGMTAFLTLLAVAAPSALAAPSLSVALSHSPETAPRSDEYLEYSIDVANTAGPAGAASAGATLACEIGTWFPSPATGNGPAYDYEWRRNGMPIVGAAENTYTLTAADEGAAIQCAVTGTNAFASSKSVALNPVVVNPQPLTPPPSSEDPKAGASRPTISGTGTATRTCSPPTNWLPKAPDTPPTYSYQWLRNATPIAGANSNEYTPVPAEDEGKLLQCEVVGETGGGGAASISNVSKVGSVTSPPENPASVGPYIPDRNATFGTVTLELELPSGDETEVAGITVGSGAWSCSSTESTPVENAKATCVRDVSIPPETEFTPVVVAAAVGADAPEPTMRATATVGGGGSAPATEEDLFEWGPGLLFGIRPGSFISTATEVEGPDYTQAGGHPAEAQASFALNIRRTSDGKVSSIGRIKNANTKVPRGFVGSQLATPVLCESVEDVLENACPVESMVGGIDLYTGPQNDDPYPAEPKTPKLPVYAIEPEYGTAAQFAFAIGLVKTSYTLSVHLRPDEGYAISLDAAPIVTVPQLIGVKATLCSFGAKRVGAGPDAPGVALGARFAGCKQPGEEGANPIPLATNPTHCTPGDPPVTKMVIASWGHPEEFLSFPYANPPLTGCDKVKFEPDISLDVPTRQADSPTGLDVELTMPTNGLEGKDDEGNPEPEALAQANLKTAKVTFPEGMAVNASAGRGLGSCSAEQVKLKTNDPVECPDSSKIGTVEIQTPILKSDLHGAVYIAKQGDVDGAVIGLYMVFDSPKDGLLIKIPGKVVPDPNTGRLVATFDESPEQPFSAVRLHFFGGPRATLLTPERCGKYQVEAELSPWTGGTPARQSSSFDVTEGPNGGPCPSGDLNASLSAGTTDPVAGKSAPFTMRLTRPDGSQRFSSLKLTPPPGLTAYLKDVPYCPDSVLNSIPTAEETGQGEIDHPSCPAASQIGTVVAGAGAGSEPFYVDNGKAYLAGPYKGAPLSIAVVTSAVAGPLDLGNVVIRNALYVNPETAQISAVSDPIPTILHGILLDIRDIRIAIDRPGFVENPTSCQEMQVAADVGGAAGGAQSLSNRFQVGDCAALGFKPKLYTRLYGPTHRGAFPSLRGVIVAHGGEANIGRAAVTLPRSEFLEQAHIRTVCTRVQFAADNCPEGSIYGHAKALTPLLGYPVTGPVYMRSSNHKLPDIVARLRGPSYQPIEAVVVGRVDSIKGQIRTTFENTPDVPISKFILRMQGGKKGLLVNSRNICRTRNRATIRLTGQNGRRSGSRPVLNNTRCAKQRRSKRKHRRHHRRHNR